MATKKTKRSHGGGESGFSRVPNAPLLVVRWWLLWLVGGGGGAACGAVGGGVSAGGVTFGGWCARSVLYYSCSHT